MFVQAMGSLVGILVGFGFWLPGTRSVARARDDRDAMGDTVATVLSGQIVLAIIAVGASLVAFVRSPDDAVLVLVLWLWLLDNALVTTILAGIADRIVPMRSPRLPREEGHAQ